ncbi:PucR family transcriptional regulator, partial [Pseudorhodoplanes sp.]|uniref:PucR family transcriptional regulator n=1 Tax=Pseudorhodoplanes sp. TaxID=1934341 RepID=UPI003D105A08
ASASEIISAMEQEIQCGLVVVSTESDAPIVSGAFGASGSVVEAALHAWSLQRTSPRGLLRLKEKRPVLMLESPTRCPTALIVAPFLDQVPSYSVLQHVAAIVALGVDRQCASREETLESSGVLLSQLIAGNTVLMENDARLGRYGLPGGPFVLLAIEAAHSQWGTSLAQLRPEQAPGLVSSWSSMESLIMCTKVNCALWLTWLADKATVGVSGSFEWDGDVSAAAYESRWALERAKRTGVAILKYEEASAFVGPRSVADARALVKRVLRPVLAYDNEHGADLIPSLKSFLGRNRSWKYAAQELYIHKQTLVYRIERVEELTGRSLKNTADVAELWLALEALDDLQPCGEDRGSEVTTLRLALEPSH